ncbi:TPA: hypothetical protein ACN4YT_001179 [Staphylococcus aureus]|nr:hypothetical protein [Staphylococcus aureus]
MTRSALKPFKNKRVMVTGRIQRVLFKNYLDRHSTFKPNVRILLKDVFVSGVSIDHLWLYEINKYYALAMELIHQRVKFSANVVPYYKINRNNNLFVQDYGIKRKGRLITEEAYNQNNQYQNKIYEKLPDIDFRLEDFYSKEN